MKQACFWHMDPTGAIVCALCPRGCKIAKGQRGFCWVRHHDDDTLFTDAYGWVCGLAVDPIEKKPLRHFLPGSTVLSFGTTGCNLRCGFCQNEHLSRAKTPLGTRMTPDQIVDTALKTACQSVAFTYNEPTVFLEFAIDTARACQARGLKTVAVTNGWIAPAPRKAFFNWIDAANVDLKAFTDRFYRELCGATLQPVLDTLAFVRNKMDVHLEVTTLLIPGQNDSPAEIDAMTKWAANTLGSDVPWHFSAYRPTANWHLAPPTPIEILLQAKGIAEQNGLRHVHLGNIHVGT